MNKLAVALIATLLVSWGGATSTAKPKLGAVAQPQAVMIDPASPIGNLLGALTPPSDKLDKALQGLQASNRPPTAVAQGYFLNLGSVLYIACGSVEASPLGAAGALIGDPPQMRLGSGTGEVIGKDRVLTAAHVVRGSSACYAGRAKARVIYQDDVADIAVLETDTADKPPLAISCDGYEPNNLYLGVGFAEGQDYVIQKFISTGKVISVPVRNSPKPIVKMALMIGYSFEGMSGGPVVDAHGRIVGLVNAGAGGGDPLMISRALADTALCTALKAPAPITTAKKD
jgi:S1-C subfamily serine protease